MIRAATILVLVPVLGLAQDSDLRLPISLDADSTEYDGKSSMLVFRGLKLSQGSIGIEADEGRASKLDFEDSVWRFEGSVVIDVDDGHIECDSADLRFVDHELRLATIKGKPATFEIRHSESDEVTYAEAGQLDYDLVTGTIEFSDEAVFTEGGNQIASNYIAYNITDRRISAQSSGEGDDKVKITFTPAEEVAGDREDSDSTADEDTGTDSP